MSRMRKILLGIPVVLLFLGSVALISVQRAKRASEYAQRSTGLAAVAFDPSPMTFLAESFDKKPAARGVAGGVPGGHSIPIPKQVIRTAEVTLVVKNVSESMGGLRDLILQQHGEVNESRVWSLSEHMREGALSVRVPAAQLEDVLKRLESSAVQVSNEKLSAVDVTRQYTDNDARMRSMKAEEQQYLSILKQAKSVQDVLDVTEKLTEVRTSIEQLQGEINLMEHDVAMASIAISLTQTAPDSSAWNTWHPLLNARHSLRGMVEGLGDWVDSVVSLAIYLPVIALWMLTIGGCGWVLWKTGRLVWQRRKTATA